MIQVLYGQLNFENFTLNKIDTERLSRLLNQNSLSRYD
jgi:hypothetical protein